MGFINISSCSTNPHRIIRWYSLFDISPNGKYIALGTSNDSRQVIRLFDIETSEQIAEFEDKSDYSRRLFSFSPDNKYFVYLDYEYNINLWSMEERSLACRISANNFIDKRELHSFSYSLQYDFTSDCTIICILAFDKILMFSIETGELIKTINIHAEQISSFKISPDNKYIAYCKRYRDDDIHPKLKIRDIETNELLATLSRNIFEFSPDSKSLVSYSHGEYSGRGFNLRTLPSCEIVYKIDEEILIPLAYWYYERAYQNTGLHSEYILTRTEDREYIRIYSMSTGELLRELPNKQNQILNGALSPNGKLLAYINNDGELYAMDIESGETTFIFDNSELKPGSPVNTTIWRLKFYDNGNLLGFTCVGPRLWSVRESKMIDLTPITNQL